MSHYFKVVLFFVILINMSGCTRHDLTLNKSEGELTLLRDSDMHRMPFSIADYESIFYHPIHVERYRLLTQSDDAMIYEKLVANHGYAFKMNMPYNADTAFNAKSVKVLGTQNDMWLMKVVTRSEDVLYVLAEEGLDEAYVEWLYSVNGFSIAELYKHYDPAFDLSPYGAAGNKDTDYRTMYDYESVIMKGLVSPITNEKPF